MTVRHANGAGVRARWATGRWLVLRRLCQAGILLLFLAGPWFGLWLVKGNLNFSYTLDLLPLTDPYVLLQSGLAGHLPEARALLGALLVVVFYALVGGRAYCAWVCPLNAITDLAAWLRAWLRLRGGVHVTRSARYWVLGATLLMALVTGSVAWELVNPVSMLHRGLIFGLGLAWSVVLAVFLLDLFVMPRGWCGRLCPIGAFYALLGRASLLRVAAVRRAACDDCNDCYTVCPEPQVIRAPLKNAAASPVILSSLCTNCGRCIDVCTKEVFAFGGRSAAVADNTGVAPAAPE
ncbi:MAG: quinol dehydrogenase ferredoxin subunit NapH [Ignavibacteria bacterium]